MPVDILRSNGGLVVVDGPDIDIPGLEDPARKPCQIAVTLLGVFYDGDDVGSQWRYTVSVNNSLWRSETRIVHRGNWDGIGMKIYDEVREHGCGATQPITIFISARELDWWILDDIGERLDMTAMPCDHEPTRRRMIIMVPVPEYPTRWVRRLLRRYTKIARLYFIFDIETKCVVSS